MNYELIQYEIKNRIAYLTLNRPEKRNAFNEKLINELKNAVWDAEQNDKVKVLVLSGNGKAFSAGADLDYLQGLQTNSFEENLADSQNLKELYEKLYSFNKITIAKVKGHAIAGGAGLATVCDFTFTTPDAFFGYTEVKIGFIPAIVMVFLLKKIGGNKAKELLLTGKLIDAEKAKEYQLVNEIYSLEEIDVQVDAFASEIIENCSGQSIENTKQMLLNINEMTMAEAFNYAAEMNAKGRETADCKKGIAAFLNKEKIVW